MAKPHQLMTPSGEASVSDHPDRLHATVPDRPAGDWVLGWWHGRHHGDRALETRAFWRGWMGQGRKPTPAKTEIDDFAARWGLAADLEEDHRALPLVLQARVEAYALGFQAGHRFRPGEEPWSALDCHLLARSLGFLEWWDQVYPLRASFLDFLRGGLAWDKMADLWPDLGPEPHRALYRDLVMPPAFSAEARVLVDRQRRFRSGSVWVLDGHRSAAGRPLLAASWASDVTEPGLPLLAARLDLPEGPLRGLGLPGMPAFLGGRNRSLAWHLTPMADDIIDLRRLDRDQSHGLGGLWAGAGRRGTLQALLELETCASVDQARERTEGTGAAPIDAAAADARGGQGRWALGVRWSRPRGIDGWLPGPWASQVPVEPRVPGPEAPGAPAGRTSVDGLAEALASRRPQGLERLLGPVRFLLPDTEAGEALRRWSGDPVEGPQARTFERLRAEVLQEFWAGYPGPVAGTPAYWGLLHRIEDLLGVPQSAWFPSLEKNRRLAEAVARAFVPGGPKPAQTLGRQAPRACWTETGGPKDRIYAAVTALVVDPHEPGWRIFNTDDETEVPDFEGW